MPVSHAQRYQAFGAVGEAGFNNTRAVACLADGILYDCFKDANGTLLTSHTADIGGSYTLFNIAGTVNREITIESNKASEGTGSTAAGAHMYVLESSASDGVITLTVTTATTAFASPGLPFRVVDGSNYWYAVLAQAAQAQQIWVEQAGTQTNPESSAQTIAASTEYDLTVTLNGAAITFAVDGLTSLTVAPEDSFNSTATLHGVGCIQTSNITAQFDDLLMVAL